MRIIVGLGNPGKKYEETRHNTGFLVINRLLEKLSLNLDEEMYNAHYCVYRNGREKIIIVEPQTYMNASGEAVAPLMKYFKLNPEDLIVVHDDLDLPVGKLRLRTSGSSGGQKGMGNIIERLGTKDIKRIRVGISNDKTLETADYVLGKFSKDERIDMDIAIEKASDALITYIKENDFSKIMNQYNQ